jgi:mRNA interferase MazF
VARQREVWFADLEPTRGREHADPRRVLVISVDQLGTGLSKLALVVPVTRTGRPSPLYEPIEPPEGGLRERSHAMPEMVRSLLRGRLVERCGRVSTGTLESVIARVGLLVRPPR